MPATNAYELIEERHISEIASLARLYRHRETGAQVMSLHNADPNKVFGVSFRTPPEDSTGVAHILEHSVLCGSDKYPAKEPFVELLKGSLQTFLNAFTYPDKTCYPVASCNRADFFNLIDVYLDAVFRPLITENIFRQEGWHYELDSANGPLTRKGVVYNEMKGAYSSPDSRLYELSQQILFPDTTYGLDSGGHPEDIPGLTYKAFKDFHRTHYHPSNARIWFWGDDGGGLDKADDTDRLSALAEYLDGAGNLEPHSEVGLQESFLAPERREEPYAASGEAKAMFTENWLLGRTEDRGQVLALEMLEHILIGLPSSPLRRELLESGLGEDLAGGGLETELRQTFFSLGLKGVAEKDVDRGMEVMDMVLSRLAESGPSEHEIEAALNCVEFDLRENNTGRFPQGLSLMLSSLTTWLYDGDPFAPLAFEAPLEKLKARLGRGEPVFQNLLDSLFLDNMHRAALVMTPDSELAARTAKAEEDSLAEDLVGMTADQVAETMRVAEELRAAQEAPDDPAALAAIPRLELSDLEPREKEIPGEDTGRGEALVMNHAIESRGLVYLDLGLDLRVLPGDLLPLAPLFGRALLEMGTSRDDFEALNLRIARTTGGIGSRTWAAPSLESGDPRAMLLVRGKSTADKAPAMLDILSDVFLDADFSDRDRFLSMVLEEKAGLEQRLIPAGHMMAATRLRAASGLAGWAVEQTSGVSALMALRDLARDVEDDWDGVLARLKRVRSLLIRQGGLTANATATAPDLARLDPVLDKFISALPGGASPVAAWDMAPNPAHEGLSLPAQVNYVGRGLDLAAAGYEYNGAARAAVKFSRTSYLWDRVRVRGGAYGAFCTLDRATGAMALVSYRDPNLASTMEAFDGLAAHLENLDLDAAQLSQSVIGAVGEMDAHMLPDAMGLAAMFRRLTGDTPECRQAMRDQLLGAGVEHFRELGAAMTRALAAGPRTVVLGSPEALKDSPETLEITKIL